MKQIEDLLDRKGLPRSCKGFIYMTYAMGIYQHGMPLTGCDGLYSLIADVFKTTEQAVERCLRYSLQYSRAIDEDEETPIRFLRKARCEIGIKQHPKKKLRNWKKQDLIDYVEFLESSYAEMKVR